MSWLPSRGSAVDFTRSARPWRTGRTPPPSVIALVRSARQDLVEAEAHMRVLLDRAEPEARSS